MIALGVSARGHADRTPLPLQCGSRCPRTAYIRSPSCRERFLTYTISWLKVEGGEMTLSASRETTPDGVPVHRITLIAESNDYRVEVLSVRDRYETWVDARDFQPLRSRSTARGGGRYESDESRSSIWRAASEAGGKTVRRFPSGSRTSISSFYFLRAQPLATGHEISVELFLTG